MAESTIKKQYRGESVTEVSTGISNVRAWKYGKIVMLYGHDLNKSVSAGGTAELGTLPSSLRPVSGLAYGMASSGSSGGRKPCDAVIQSNGLLFVESSTALTIQYFSAVYITSN